MNKTIMKENKVIKKEHFSNLVTVAYADGILSDDEKIFLEERAIDYGLSKAEVDDIIARVDILKFMVPLNEEEKEEQLSDIVYMSMIDGEVHKKEYEICLTIAKRLEFKQKDLDHIIKLTKKLWEK